MTIGKQPGPPSNVRGSSGKSTANNISNSCRKLIPKGNPPCFDHFPANSSLQRIDTIRPTKKLRKVLQTYRELSSFVGNSCYEKWVFFAIRRSAASGRGTEIAKSNEYKRRIGVSAARTERSWFCDFSGKNGLNGYFLFFGSPFFGSCAPHRLGSWDLCGWWPLKKQKLERVS